MEKRGSKNKEIDEKIDTLIGIPAKNLENKINELEAEINMRRNVLNEALTGLGTRGLQLEEKIWQMRYSGININVLLEKELSRTEIRETDELISYFRDVSRLKEKLQDAREEFELEKEKRKLVKK